LLNGDRKIFTKLEELVLAYYHAAKTGKPMNGIKTLRKLLGDAFQSTWQQCDAEEALVALFKPYKTDTTLAALIENNRLVDVNSAEVLSDIVDEKVDREDRSEIGADRILKKTDPAFPLQLVVPHAKRQFSETTFLREAPDANPLVFSELYDGLSTPILSDDTVTVIHDNKLIKAKYKAYTHITSLPDTLLIEVKRFDNEKGFSRKLYNHVTVNAQETFSGKKFNLEGFVLHKGGVEGGHYTTYCKIDNDNWQCFDDRQRPKGMLTAEALEIAKQAYIYLFEKV